MNDDASRLEKRRQVLRLCGVLDSFPLDASKILHADVLRYIDFYDVEQLEQLLLALGKVSFVLREAISVGQSLLSRIAHVVADTKNLQGAVLNLAGEAMHVLEGDAFSQRSDLEAQTIVEAWRLKGVPVLIRLSPIGRTVDGIPFPVPPPEAHRKKVILRTPTGKVSVNLPADEISNLEAAEYNLSDGIPHTHALRLWFTSHDDSCGNLQPKIVSARSWLDVSLS